MDSVYIVVIIYKGYYRSTLIDLGFFYLEEIIAKDYIIVGLKDLGLNLSY
jgi:hypothetical protein